MICPACGNILHSLRVGDITIDTCRGGCGGIWFDNFELQKMDEPHDPMPPMIPAPHAHAHKTASGKRPCPRCEGIFLKRRFFSPEKRVQVDECGGCGGIWLDAGELERIRHESMGRPKGHLREEEDPFRMVYQYLNQA